MAEYRVGPGVRATVRRRILQTGVPMALLSASVAIGVVVAKGAPTEVLLILFPLLVGAIATGVFKSYRRQLEQLLSYRLVVEPDRIMREMNGVPALMIRLEDVQRIESHASGGYTVYARTLAESIRIPPNIGNEEVLAAELARWRRIEPAQGPSAHRWSVLSGLAMMIALAVEMLATNRLVVIVVGSLLIMATGTCGVLLWRNTQIDIRLRRSALGLIVPVLALVAHVVSAIVGHG